MVFFLFEFSFDAPWFSWLGARVCAVLTPLFLVSWHCHAELMQLAMHMEQSVVSWECRRCRLVGLKNNSAPKIVERSQHTMNILSNLDGGPTS